MPLSGGIKDPKYPASDGWEKRSTVVRSVAGKKFDYHWFYNTRTGTVRQFKHKAYRSSES